MDEIWAGILISYFAHGKKESKNTFLRDKLRVVSHHRGRQVTIKQP